MPAWTWNRGRRRRLFPRDLCFFDEAVKCTEWCRRCCYLNARSHFSIFTGQSDIATTWSFNTLNKRLCWRRGRARLLFFPTSANAGCVSIIQTHILSQLLSKLLPITSEWCKYKQVASLSGFAFRMPFPYTMDWCTKVSGVLFFGVAYYLFIYFYFKPVASARNWLYYWLIIFD